MKIKYKCALMVLNAYVLAIVFIFSQTDINTTGLNRILKDELTVVNGTKQIRETNNAIRELKRTTKTELGGILKCIRDKERCISLLYGAVAGNSSKNSIWDRLTIVGWTLQKYERPVNGCCVLFSSGLMKSYPVISINHGPWPCEVPRRQYICSLKGLNEIISWAGQPVSTTIRFEGDICSRNRSLHVNIVYPSKHPGKIAVFGKIVYGNVSTLNLLAWFEIHKMFGVDKVLMYTLNVEREATMVLDHYRRSGLLETVPYAIPGPEHQVPKTPFGTKNYQGWEDEMIAYTDALERLRGFKYLVSIDIDEYLLPRRHETLTELFDKLWTDKPNAGGFIFKTYFVRKGPEFAMSDSPFDVCRYLNRSHALKDRPKHVTMPERIKYDGLGPHNFKAKPGYRSFQGDEEDAILRHYRFCKSRDLGSKFSCYVNRTIDATACLEFKKVENTVFKIASSLGLNF